ncbi:hypothetical protein W04_3584 [Pseudoalteromonas sp. SW0106-04]|nr:hypothetical protein W04_3584 [Pseudoalteromonas sp. SW0106-04]
MINAQAETAREKKTFRQAMQSHRCLIPCSGWYEWRDEGDKRKQKYLFSGSKVHALFMAGIYYPNDLGAQLITLTIRPNSKCSQYHGRMPLLIHPEDIDYWLWSSADELTPLMEPVPSQAIKVDATS